MTHAELVARAVRWLRSRRRCSVVMAECGTWCVKEIPDAIGWTWRGVSTLVECKVSLTDFRADRRKESRRGAGLGAARFYMAPAGILPLADIPEGWGLVEVRRAPNGRLASFTVREATAPPWNFRPEGREGMEIALLVAEMRRLTCDPRLHDGADYRRVGALVGKTADPELRKLSAEAAQ